jgi:hypothetical protein
MVPLSLAGFFAWRGSRRPRGGVGAKKRTPLRERGTTPPPRDNAAAARKMMRTARASWEGAIAPRTTVGIITCCLRLGFAGRPPDEPKRAEDRDLQDDEEKEDWPEPTHDGSV